MARIWTSGFELQSVTAAVEFDTITNSPTIDTTTKRSGAASLRCNTSATTAAIRHAFSASSILSATIYGRMYIYIASAPAALCSVMRFTNVATNRCEVRLATNRTLELWNSSAKVGSSSSVLSTNTWYRVELKATADASGIVTDIEAKLDGTAFSSASSQAIGAISSFTVGVLTSTTADLYFDDLAINDNSGSFQNGYPGEGKITHLMPDSTGDSAQWRPTSGANWSNVDEIPPNDATDIVDTQARANNDTDDYNLAATTSEIGSTDTINVVSVGVRMLRSTNNTSDTFVTRIKAASGGTVEESATLQPNSNTTWRTNANAAPRLYTQTLYDLPGASTTAWTKSDLDAAQVGLRIVSAANTADAQVSTLWVLVDSAPVSSATISVSDSVTVTESTTVTVINAKVETLTDNFNDNSLDSTKWTSYTANAATVAETSQEIDITPANSTLNSEAGIRSVANYTLINSYAVVNAVQVANTTNVFTNFQLYLDANNYIAIGIGSGNLEYFQEVGGAFSAPYSAAYNSSLHKWWRLREASGFIYADYSADGITWINFYTAANPIALTSLQVQLLAKEHTSTASPSVAKFDNFNIVTSGSAIDTIADDFNDNSTNATLWNTYTASAATVSETGQRVQYNLAATTSGSWAGYHSKAQYNLTGKRVWIEIPAGTSGGHDWFDLTLSMEQLPVVDNFFSIGIDYGTTMLQAIVEQGGADTTLTEIAYSSTSHRFVSLRESGGTIYWEYSSDGVTWTQLYSHAIFDGLPITNLYIVLDDYEYDGTSSPGTHYIDSLNIPQISESETITIVESSTVRVADNINVNDAVTTTESVTLSIPVTSATISVFDAVSITENTALSIVNNVSVNDAITVVEQITLQIPVIHVNVNDAITIVENTTVRVTNTVNVFDAITIVESTTIKIPILHISTSDSVAVTELTAVSLGLRLSVNDVVTIQEPRRNYVTNPAFETDAIGNGVVPAGWSAFNTAGVQNYKGPVTDAVDDHHSYQIDASSNTDTGILYTITGLTIGETYTASAFMQTDPTVVNASITLRDGNGNNTQNIGAALSGRYTTTRTATQTFLDLLIGLGSYGAQSSGVVYFDSVIIEKTPTDNGYFDGDYPYSQWEGTADLSESRQGLLFELTTVVTSVSVNVSDSVTVVENTSLQVNSYISVNDTVSLAESVSLLPVSYISVSDAITIAESTALSLVSSIGVFDSISVVESVTVQIPTLTPSVFDTVTIVESTTIRTNLYLSVFDAVSIVESTTLQIPTLHINTFDSISIIESSTVIVQTGGITVVENIAVSETTAIQIPVLHVSVNDVVSVVENTSVYVPVNVSVIDTLTIVENTQVRTNNTISANDLVTVSESITLLVQNYVTVSDSISLVESTTARSQSYINVSDSIIVSESILFVLQLYVSVFDSISTTEYLNIGTFKEGDITLDEPVVVQEYLSIHIPLALSVSDSIIVSESITIGNKWYRENGTQATETNSPDWESPKNTVMASKNNPNWYIDNNTVFNRTIDND